MLKFFTLFVFCLISNFLLAQQTPSSDIEELKKEILQLNTQVDHIQFNLGQSQSKFKRGIAVATIGYSVTITGGLMLGRKNDNLGTASGWRSAWCYRYFYVSRFIQILRQSGKESKEGVGELLVTSFRIHKSLRFLICHFTSGFR